MTNLNTILNDRIARVTRKEIKAATGTTRKAAVRYRGEIAALKRGVASLHKAIAVLESQAKKQVVEEPLPKETDDIRFRADGLKSHRARLGLSAKEYGTLVGVSGLTIYSWETGKRRPRRAQVLKLAGVRGIGKREAMRRLGSESGGNGAAAGNGKRGQYRQTGEELILSLLKKKKGMTSAEINIAWRKAGRPGICNYLISNMLKAGQLRSVKLKQERGSRYSIA